jgi:hypothetical protein
MDVICENELKLLNFDSSVISSDYDLLDFRVDIWSKLDSLFVDYYCRYVELQIDFNYSSEQQIKLLLKTSNRVNCELGFVPPPFNPYRHWIHIYITENDTLYVRRNISSLDSIRLSVVKRYEELDINNYTKVNIAILWDSNADRNKLKLMIRECIDGYLEFANQFSFKVFGKPICNLSELQLTILHEKLPFILRTEISDLIDGKFDYLPHQKK